MATITLQVPDDLQREKDQTIRFIAAKLYESGRLTLGQAAEMCGMKKWEFPEVLASFDVHFFQYTIDDIVADVERITKA